MLTTLLTVALLHWVVLLTPGVNFVLVTQLAASGRRSSAGMAAVGVSAVTLTWAVLAIWGVGYVFSAHPVLRLVLQVAGGLYLLNLARRMWRSTGVGESGLVLELTHAAAFRRGLYTNILNPKTALFFGSVFATTLPPNPDVKLQWVAVALVYGNALVWHLVLATAFSHPHIQASYARQQSRLNRFSAGMVGAFGSKLLYVTAQEFQSK